MLMGVLTYHVHRNMAAATACQFYEYSGDQSYEFISYGYRIVQLRRFSHTTKYLLVRPHRAVGPEGEFRDLEGRPGPFSWWSERSQALFRNATRCLGLPDSEELWRAAVSVRVSWDIFNLLRLDDDGNSLLKVGLTFENDVGRLFFIAYCFFLCAKEDRAQRHVDTFYVSIIFAVSRFPLSRHS
ncbi:hypothetical protein HPB50_003144 [Hyalomma asiaticum]|uniref:Uncharacterized protein n=1 Tax=Hyalomma asiaticum TaxID=266040 RepID=A0ACB7SMR5_HYAAI|nr:hypothetical protein HPB50_003144 [Hyalomma asiaticum]